MTYGFVPSNWYAFARELEARGLVPGDIEKIEMRPRPAGEGAALIDVVVTARSGQVHTWTQEETVSAAARPR